MKRYYNISNKTTKKNKIFHWVLFHETIVLKKLFNVKYFFENKSLLWSPQWFSTGTSQPTSGSRFFSLIRSLKPVSGWKLVAKLVFLMLCVIFKFKFVWFQLIKSCKRHFLWLELIMSLSDTFYTTKKVFFEQIELFQFYRSKVCDFIAKILTSQKIT
jgi:hypothetical protein